MINAKFVPAGVKESDFTEEGEGKESLKQTQSKAKRNVQLGLMSKMGDLLVEIFNGRGFDASIRHVLFLRLQGGKCSNNIHEIKSIFSKQNSKQRNDTVSEGHKHSKF